MIAVTWDLFILSDKMYFNHNVYNNIFCLYLFILFATLVLFKHLVSYFKYNKLFDT